jgi:gamma-glutamylcyclotransferase (GGCT)/AIG2-like uncharacterized protein YtfP
MTNVFAYGTFMTGYHNHRYMKEYTPEKAILFNYRRIWPEIMGFPIIIEKKGASVKGELYKNVNDTDLAKMDRLEGVPHFYTKRIVEVIIIKGENNIQAIVYYPNDDMIRKWVEAENKEKKTGNS